jgi:glutathione reductase (NADPH)
MSDLQFDAIVIGGGSGGSGFARRAGGYGKKVAIIERGVARDEQGNRLGAGYGGTCVNVGCVPKKIMFMAASHKEMFDGPAATLKGFGFQNSGELTFNWADIKVKRDAYVKRLNGVYSKNWSNGGATVFDGVASFVSPTEVKVVKSDGSGEVILKSDTVVVAAGGFPSNPNYKGLENTITSDGFFELESQPKKAAVVGAGYIAVELAGIFQALGTDTSLFFRGETVMRRGFDPFIVETLMEALQEHGPTLIKKSDIVEVRKEADDTKTIIMKDGKEYPGFDCVLLAIGRTPATAGMNLEAVGVELDKIGQIKVDKFENTNVPGIYALGDITTTGYALTPVAIAAGRRLADRLYGGQPKARIAYECIPTVVFSHPVIGTVGLTEPDAIEQYGADQVKTFKSKFASMLFAFNDDHGKVKTGLKLVCVGEEEKVVGMHIIGPQSDEILQGFGVAIRMGARKRDFEASMAIHPTIAEEIVTLAPWGQRDNAPVLAPYNEAD